MKLARQFGVLNLVVLHKLGGRIAERRIVKVDRQRRNRDHSGKVRSN